MPYAEVSVNAAAPLRQTFTYRIPEGLPVAPGHAVYVPFGTRTLQGIVMEVTDEPAFPEARDIETVIDDRPMLSPAHIALVRWLSDHYLAPLFDCVSLMLPAGFKRRPLAILSAAPGAGPPSDLTEAQRAALEAVAARGEVESDELRRALKVRGLPRAVSELLRRGLLTRSYRLSRPPVSAKVVPQLRLLLTEDAAREQAGRLRADDHVDLPGSLCAEHLLPRRGPS